MRPPKPWSSCPTRCSAPGARHRRLLAYTGYGSIVIFECNTGGATVATQEKVVLNHLDPASALAFGLLIFSLLMVVMFEASNGFHDAANAVATVIYTKPPARGET